VAQIGAKQVAAGPGVALVYGADTEFQPVIQQFDAGAAATRELLVAGTGGFIDRNDVNGIEEFIAAGDRLFEKQRAVERIDVVVEEARQLA
jgi:hypothetical protein